MLGHLIIWGGLLLLIGGFLARFGKFFAGCLFWVFVIILSIAFLRAGFPDGFYIPGYGF